MADPARKRTLSESSEEGQEEQKKSAKKEDDSGSDLTEVSDFSSDSSSSDFSGSSDEDSEDGELSKSKEPRSSSPDQVEPQQPPLPTEKLVSPPPPASPHPDSPRHAEETCPETNTVVKETCPENNSVVEDTDTTNKNLTNISIQGTEPFGDSSGSSHQSINNSQQNSHFSSNSGQSVSDREDLCLEGGATGNFSQDLLELLGGGGEGFLDPVFVDHEDSQNAADLDQLVFENDEGRDNHEGGDFFNDPRLGTICSNSNSLGPSKEGSLNLNEVEDGELPSSPDAVPSPSIKAEEAPSPGVAEIPAPTKERTRSRKEPSSLKPEKSRSHSKSSRHSKHGGASKSGGSSQTKSRGPSQTIPDSASVSSNVDACTPKSRDSSQSKASKSKASGHSKSAKESSISAKMSSSLGKTESTRNHSVISAQSKEKSAGHNKSTHHDHKSTLTQDPKSSSQDLKSSSQDPKSSSQDLKPSSQDLKSSSQDPKSSSQDPKSSSQDFKSSSQDPKSSSQDPKSSSHDPKSSSQDPKSSTHNIKHHIASDHKSSQDPRSSGHKSSDDRKSNDDRKSTGHDRSQCHKTTSELDRKTSSTHDRKASSEHKSSDLKSASHHHKPSHKTSHPAKSDHESDPEEEEKSRKRKKLKKRRELKSASVDDSDEEEAKSSSKSKKKRRDKSPTRRTADKSKSSRSSRPKEESIRPKEEASRPKEESIRPKEEASRPKEESARPKEESARSKEKRKGDALEDKRRGDALEDNKEIAAEKRGSAEVRKEEMKGTATALEIKGNALKPVTAVPDAKDKQTAVPDAKDKHTVVPDAKDKHTVVPDAKDKHKAVPDAKDKHKDLKSTTSHKSSSKSIKPVPTPPLPSHVAAAPLPPSKAATPAPPPSPLFAVATASPPVPVSRNASSPSNALKIDPPPVPATEPSKTVPQNEKCAHRSPRSNAGGEDTDPSFSPKGRAGESPMHMSSNDESGGKEYLPMDPPESEDSKDEGGGGKRKKLSLKDYKAKKEAEKARKSQGESGSDVQNESGREPSPEPANKKIRLQTREEDSSKLKDNRSKSKDDRLKPKDDRSKPKDDRSKSKDDRSKPKDDRSKPKDDRSKLKDDLSKPKDDRSKPKDDVPLSHSEKLSHTVSKATENNGSKATQDIGESSKDTSGKAPGGGIDRVPQDRTDSVIKDREGNEEPLSRASSANSKNTDDDFLSGFDVLDEVLDNGSDTDSKEVYDSDSVDEDVYDMLDADLPTKAKDPAPENVPEMMTKMVLDEKGGNEFEVLPLGWVIISHNCGMPLYLHRDTRVVSLSRPYHVGSAGIRQHNIPISAIPCYSYRYYTEKENATKKKMAAADKDKEAPSSSQASEQAKIDATKKGYTGCPFSGGYGGGRENVSPDSTTIDNNTAREETAMEVDSTTAVASTVNDVSGSQPSVSGSQPSGSQSSVSGSLPAVAGSHSTATGVLEVIGETKRNLTTEEMHEYCTKRFNFKALQIPKFESWKARRDHFRQQRRDRADRILPPELPEGTKVLTIPTFEMEKVAGTDGATALNQKVVKKSRKKWVFNPNGKSAVCLLHEYVQHSLRTAPKYEYDELDNAATPYSASISINGMAYGQGVGPSKKIAKAKAARQTLEMCMPELKKLPNPEEEALEEGPDLKFFNDIRVEDPRVAELCNRASEPGPYYILLNCLQRNYGLGDTNVVQRMQTARNHHQEYIMSVNKREISVICKNKKDGKQLAAQKLLQQLHPNINNWGSLLRMYGNRSTRIHKQKKQKESEVLALQSKASINGTGGHSLAILNKLKEEMRNLREIKMSIVPIGKFQPPAGVSASGLHTDTLEI